MALDKFTNIGNGTGTVSATHTPTGTPRAVIVIVTQYMQSTNQINTVSYGGVTVPLAVARQHIDTAPGGEPAYAGLFFLGASIPTGAQTCQVTVTGSSRKDVFCITYTAAADTEVQSTDSLSGDTLTNPSRTLALSGNSCAVLMGGMSGANNSGQVTELAGWTNRSEIDPGDVMHICYTYNTVSTADVTWGTTQAGHDACLVAAAIKEIAADAFVPVINFP
jgi:hypothetical protein